MGSHTNEVQVGLDLGLDRDNGLDDGLDDDDNTGVVLMVALAADQAGHLDVEPGGVGALVVLGRARGLDIRDADAGVLASAGAGSDEGSGHGGANREGGEGGAEELHGES